MPATGRGAADGNQSGVDGANVSAHGGGTGQRNRGPGRGRLTGQLAPGYALRELARQPTRTRTNYPEEWHSTENFGLDFEEYVRGQIHTQGIDNFWSLLKRGLTGTYIAVEPFHLDRYLGEQTFRYNNRATRDNPLTDADRFSIAVTQIVGKRLTYAELTGKELKKPEAF